MKISINRQILFLGLIIVLLVSACAQEADPTPAPLAATVDTSDIVDEVLSELRSDLENQPLTPVEKEVVEPEVDTDSIVERVLAEVKEQLADLQEPTPTPVPVTFANEAGESAGKVLQEALMNLYRQTNPSVVFIIVPPLGSGTGFVFSNDGYIVTNNHVVDAGRTFEVAFSNGERREGELIGTDVDSDLAVLQVEDLPEGVEPLPLGSSQDVAVGQFVVAIGNPFGEQGSMSLGIVSGLNRSLTSQRGSETAGNSYSLPDIIQTDAPINPGNSGGPLLNLEGQVVGVNSAIATSTGTNSGVGFSIPVDAVKRIIPKLIEEGTYNYPYMGAAFDSEVSLRDLSTFGLSQTQGAYVVNVTAGSPADKAGLVEADAETGMGGDLIVAIDDREINNFADLNSYLVFNTIVGQTINITVLRDGEVIEIPLTLGKRP